MGELIDLGVDRGIIKKSGSWYTYDGATIGQGREAAKTWFRENNDAREVVKRQVKESLGMAPLKLETNGAVAEEA
jgi:recombination protein RecA